MPRKKGAPKKKSTRVSKLRLGPKGRDVPVILGKIQKYWKDRWNHKDLIAIQRYIFSVEPQLRQRAHDNPDAQNVLDLSEELLNLCVSSDQLTKAHDQLIALLDEWYGFDQKKTPQDMGVEGFNKYVESILKSLDPALQAWFADDLQFGAELERRIIRNNHKISQCLAALRDKGKAFGLDRF